MWVVTSVGVFCDFLWRNGVVGMLRNNLQFLTPSFHLISCLLIICPSVSLSDIVVQEGKIKIDFSYYYDTEPSIRIFTLGVTIPAKEFLWGCETKKG